MRFQRWEGSLSLSLGFWISGGQAGPGMDACFPPTTMTNRQLAPIPGMDKCTTVSRLPHPQPHRNPPTAKGTTDVVLNDTQTHNPPDNNIKP